MATILDKDLTRETTVKVDEREIQITLTEKQTISMKLKGMKSGALDIPIVDLYNQLRGSSSISEEPVKASGEKHDISSYKEDSSVLISLNDIRHAAIVRGFDLETTAKFDSFIADLIRERKARKLK